MVTDRGSASGQRKTGNSRRGGADRRSTGHMRRARVSLPLRSPSPAHTGAPNPVSLTPLATAGPTARSLHSLRTKDETSSVHPDNIVNSSQTLRALAMDVSTTATGQGDLLLLNGTASNASVTSNASVFNTTTADVSEAPSLLWNDSGTVFTTPTYVFIWVTLANLLVLVVGVVGNVLVIVVVTCVRDMRTPTNLCLMNLSLADLLVLLICQPSALLEFYALEKWMLGDFMCKMTVFLENTVCLASILIILTVSFERYYAVCYPLRKYSTESRSKALLLMLLMWVTAAALTAPFLAITHTATFWHYVYLAEVTVCMSQMVERWQTAYIIARFVLVFVVPLCLLIFLYSRIVFKVAVDTMDSRQMTDKARAQVQRSRQQLVVMLVGVVVLFFVCLLPFRIVALFEIHKSFELDKEIKLNVMNLARLLVYVNSAGNPIIYSLVSTKFRRAFARVLHRLGCRCKLLNLTTSSDENGTLRRTTVTHYTTVRQEQDDAPTDSV